jgi:hypothetical protein
VRQPFNGRAQAQIVEDARTQFGGNTAHAADGVLDQLDQRRHPRRRIFVVRIDLPIEEGQVHAHAGQRLAQFVVDFPGDAHTLLFAHGLDVGRQGA